MSTCSVYSFIASLLILHVRHSSVVTKMVLCFITSSADSDMVELSQAALCGALGAMWLDLEGAELPDVGHRLHPHACLTYRGNCYVDKVEVTVLNCRDFFLYFLHPCTQSSADCATIDN